MGLDIWFVEDIRNALLAANEASAATAAVIAEVGWGPSTPRPFDKLRTPQARDEAGLGQAATDSTDLLAMTLQAYREGYKAALATVALAFGIAPRAITRHPPSEPEVTYLPPKLGESGGNLPLRPPQPLQTPQSGDEP